ncbi:hypothetical protein OSTOST_04235 [Ostertagia ostertagi]
MQSVFQQELMPATPFLRTPLANREPFLEYNAGQSGDFMKYTQEQNDNFGLAYDYGSIMHYAAADYSTDGSPNGAIHKHRPGARMADFLIPETARNAYVLVVTEEIYATKE